MAGNSFGPGGSFWQSGAGNKPVISGSGGGSASKPVGRRGRGAKGKTAPAYDANAALEAWLSAHDTVDGGSGGGGSGGGGGGGGGVDFSGMRNNANARNAGQKQQLDDLYGDYAKLVEGNPAATKRSYDTLIAQSAEAGQGIAQQATAQQDKNNAQRDAGLASLGVSPEAVAASPSQENVATQRGLTDLAGQNSSWGNLQGVLSQAQQTRDKLDIQGVGDAKVLAHRQLAQNYEDFMRELDAQLAASYGGGGGGSSGGGGGGGTVTNKYRGKMEDAIFAQLLGAAGLGSEAPKAPSRPKVSTSTTTRYDTAGRPVGSSTTTKKG